MLINDKNNHQTVIHKWLAYYNTTTSTILINDKQDRQTTLHKWLTYYNTSILKIHFGSSNFHHAIIQSCKPSLLLLNRKHLY